MNAWGHFKTITSHKLLVMKYCFKVGLYKQGLLHDLSKYSPTEFLVGAKYYQGTRSPNNAEREATGVSTSWLHHKGRNRHHFEYWTDYNPSTKEVSAVKMPAKYVVEMLCDRVAASKVYQGKNYTDAHPLEYFLRGKARRKIHPETSDLIEKMLRILADEGEASAFLYAKNLLRKKDIEKY